MQINNFGFAKAKHTFAKAKLKTEEIKGLGFAEAKQTFSKVKGEHYSN